MSENEIVRSYKQAVRPKQQITILSELNACPRSDIIKILQKHGYANPDELCKTDVKTEGGKGNNIQIN